MEMKTSLLSILKREDTAVAQYNSAVDKYNLITEMLVNAEKANDEEYYNWLVQKYSTQLHELRCDIEFYDDRITRIHAEIIRSLA